jgi:sec-independent protein translocase protein TatA
MMMSNSIILFISGQEIFIIFVFVLLLFGAKKIPEVARSLGKGMKEFRKATDDIKRELNDSSKEFTEDIKDIQDKVNKP